MTPDAAAARGVANGQPGRGTTPVADLGLPAGLRRRVVGLLASAYRDELTGALTRRAGKDYLADEVQRARRAGSGLAVAFVDVDGLKVTNDNHGHAAGDGLLIAVVKALSASMRSYDRVVRLGGDEFICVVPAGTEQAVSACVARARRLLAASHPGASFSAGVAALLPGETADALVSRADEALYAARADTGWHPLPTVIPRGQEPLGQTADKGPGDVGCGLCGGRIPLTDFVLLHSDAFATRSADCASCGETTLIRLSTSIAFNANWKLL